MSSPPLNDSLFVAVKYDCNQGLDWYSREPGFDRNKLQDLQTWCIITGVFTSQSRPRVFLFLLVRKTPVTIVLERTSLRFTCNHKPKL